MTAAIHPFMEEGHWQEQNDSSGQDIIEKLKMTNKINHKAQKINFYFQ